MDLGSWADWVAAGGSVSAVVVASFAAVATIRTNSAQQKTLELQRQQLKAAEDDKRSAQASKVTFFLSEGLAQPEWDRVAGERSLIREWPSTRLEVVNRSDMPVTLVRLILDEAEPEHANAKNLGTEHRRDLDLKVVPHEGSGKMILEKLDSKNFVNARLQFYDSAGNRWTRFLDGRLEQVDDAVVKSIANPTTLIRKSRKN